MIKINLKFYIGIRPKSANRSWLYVVCRPKLILLGLIVILLIKNQLYSL